MRRATALAVVSSSLFTAHLFATDAAPTVSAELMSEALDTRNDPFVFSKDGLHIAAVVSLGSRQGVMFDGKNGAKFDEIIALNNKAPLTFSDDGTHLAYFARRGGEKFMVVDGKEIPVSPQTNDITVATFSPDGKQFVFVMDGESNTRQVVLDGVPQEPLLGVHELQFTADSKHLAYIANGDGSRHSSGAKDAKVDDKGTCLIIDGKRGPRFDDIKELTFSSDGAHHAYVGYAIDSSVEQKYGKPPIMTHSLVIDGESRLTATSVQGLQLSADGKHVLCFVGKPSRAKKNIYGDPTLDLSIWLDGAMYPYGQADSAVSSAEVTTGQFKPVLSPDGTKVAYLQLIGTPGYSRDVAVAVNGKAGAGYSQVSDLCFSGDSKHVYYLATQNKGKDRRFFVDNDDEAGPYERPREGEHNFGITLSPDAQHFAYSAASEEQVSVVIDGKAGEKFKRIDLPLVWSGDSKHTAFVGFNYHHDTMSPTEVAAYEKAHPAEKGELLVVDNQARPLPGALGNLSQLVFSPDGKHVAISGAETLTVDGRAVPLAKAYRTFRAPKFTADSAHVLFVCVEASLSHGSKGDNAERLYIDDAMVPDYAIRGEVISQPDGKVQCFAVDVKKGALVKLTIKPAPAKNFGLDAAPAIVAAKPGSESSAAQASQTAAQPAPTKISAADKAQKAKNSAQKGINDAKNAADALGGIGNIFKKR